MTSVPYPRLRRFLEVANFVLWPLLVIAVLKIVGPHVFGDAW